MKVLLSAYSCLPNAGSEPGIGWNWAQCIAACGHKVFVITRAINQNSIEAACKKDAIQNPRFLFHDLSPTLQKLYKLPFGNYAYYFLWQYTAANLASRVHAQENFDQVQHITWGSFRLPSFMGKLGIPFIFGPVAGGEDTPKNLRQGLGPRGRLWDFLRRISNFVLTRAPLMTATYRHAIQIAATTNETLRAIPASYRHKAVVQQAVGIDPQNLQFSNSDNSPLPLPSTNSKLNLLFVGRLLPWKGIHLALKAIAALGPQSKDVHLTIVGSGSDHARLQHLARRLGLTESVSWIPWMKREQLFRMYSQFDLFLFPSLHDSGGMAVLEAMSFGLPVLCLDLGGPAISVDSTCGKVIPTNRRTEEEVVSTISSSLSQLLSDRSLLEPLSLAAASRVSSFSWQSAVNSFYRSSSVPAHLQATSSTEINPVTAGMGRSSAR
jgi:glycosyltransferase involved in cell wall biosynthesis